MKIIHAEQLISAGTFPKSREWKRLRNSIYKIVKAVDWPPGSGKFTIYPESGKKRGQGNGVVPIKNGLMSQLTDTKWKLEQPLDLATVSKPGKLDAVYECKAGPFALEWETGNISSSHRALNKMSLGLLKRKLIGGMLIVPSREMYQYLTDRIGNWNELLPYVDLWKSIQCRNGVLEILVIEHDATSRKVSRIPKTTSGRALR